MATIGNCWVTTSWATPAWAPGSWKNVGPSPSTVVAPPTPTVLLFEDTATTLGFLGDDGFEMSTPLIFTVGVTGPLTVFCTGADGTREDLSTAISATLRVVNVNGTVAVNGVALSNLTSNGTAVWNRQSSEVATSGDYRSQVTVIRADATVGRYPDGNGAVGAPVTILPAV